MIEPIQIVVLVAQILQQCHLKALKQIGMPFLDEQLLLKDER